jgi:small subunit ribosomal protein S9
VKLFTRGDRVITVNGRPFSVYFPTEPLREIAKAALTKMNVDGKFRVVVSVEGGGLHAQAEAMRHGTARALLQFNPDFRKRLKRAGYLTRDPRMVERKKPGRKKARRMPQWSKR